MSWSLLPYPSQVGRMNGRKKQSRKRFREFNEQDLIYSLYLIYSRKRFKDFFALWRCCGDEDLDAIHLTICELLILFENLTHA